MRKFIVTAGVGALAAALSSGAMPWLQAASGAFKPPDSAQDFGAAQVFAAGSDPYEVDFAALHAKGPANSGGPGVSLFPAPTICGPRQLAIS